MSKKSSKLNSRLVAALMVMISLCSASASFAYPDSSDGSETHDSSYVKSLQKGLKGELLLEEAPKDLASKLSEPVDQNAGAPIPSGNSPSVTTASSTSSSTSTATSTSTSAEKKSTSATETSSPGPLGGSSPIKTGGSSPDDHDKLPADSGVVGPGAYIPSDDIDGRPLASLPPLTPGLPESSDVIIIDNDQYKRSRESSNKDESKQTSSLADVRSEEGKTVILAGARFPVVLLSSHTSRSCRIGDRVEARLKSDILIGDRLIAGKDAQVIGHVSSAHKARRLLTAELAPKRWLRANGAIGIKFDEIITQGGEHIPLTAAPARMARIIENKAEGRVLGVNHKGEVSAPLSTQLKNQGIQMAIRGAAGAGGVFSMGAVPILFGLIGAANPSFAFLHSVGKNVPHRRWKGFGMGFLSGLPGGFLVADFILKGVEAAIKPGDEFLVEFQQDFNGEAATTAELQPQENMKVRAEVVRTRSPKSQKSKKPASESAKKAELKS